MDERQFIFYRGSGPCLLGNSVCCILIAFSLLKLLYISPYHNQNMTCSPVGAVARLGKLERGGGGGGGRGHYMKTYYLVFKRCLKQNQSV